MHRNKKSISLTLPTLLYCGIFALVNGAARGGEPVTIESLLREMVSRESIARFPDHDFRLKQASSYNRASKTPDEPVGWFTNHDFNKSSKDKNFIRIEEINGQSEWVIMEDEGPGAIVRTWMPFKRPPEDTLIRFYLDGSDTPALEGNVCTLLNGSGLIPYPFAHPSLLSAVSFFPIPYAKRCKVTMTKMPYFFQVTYRKYAEDTPVKTFALADFEAAASLTKKVGASLLDPQVEGAGDPLEFKASLEMNQEQALELPAGAAAVRELSIKLGTYDDPKVTRTVVLKMSFDGKETVWCPIGDFFGCGVGLNPFQGWYRTVVEDGTMTCRWVMPYQESGRISLVNLGDKAVDAHLKVSTAPWTWDDRSMYFNAAWRGQYPVPTQPRSDWNYITTKGRGVYVGDTLTIINPVVGWWGEGDEKIWVDDEAFPSIFGTGTEDYYAYSWGGESTDFYEHPFHAQPHAHVYNKLNRKDPENLRERDCRGFSVETRTRALDTMPFGSSLKLDLEVWSKYDCDMGYAAGTYWYAFAETESNRKPDAEGVRKLPALPEITKAPAKPGVRAFGKAVECEQMKIAAKSAGLVAAPQSLIKIKGRWSNASHLLVRSEKVGDFVELRIPAKGAGARKLVLHATKSRDFGIVRFTVNGKPAGADLDLYAGKPVPSGPIELGVFAPVDKAFVLRAEVVGKSPKSKGVFFGLDCLEIPPATPAPGAASQAKPLRQNDDRPNVMIIMAADLGYTDLGCYGWEDIRTPHIDSLARDGVKITSAYVTGSMCGPSRAGFITGRFQSSAAQTRAGAVEAVFDA